MTAGATRRDVVVLGSGRSGTSMVAGLFANAGWHAGERLYEARDANPKGFFESPEINNVNEYLLAQVLPASAGLTTGQRWLADLDADQTIPVPDPIDRRIARLVATKPFCFKDPRFSYTLPAWEPHLVDALRLCVFRDPMDTAASIVKECAAEPYLASVAMDTERALAVWAAMYRSILERLAGRGDWLFAHYDQILSGERTAAIEAAVGAPLDASFPDRGLRRSAGDGALTPEVADLYGELCDRAGYTPPPRPVRVPVAVQEHAAPELSVILCTYNRRPVLARCLDALERQTAAGRFEVVCVDDGSTDGTAEHLDCRTTPFPLRVLHQPNGGLAAARNTAIAAARGRLLLLINDDTIAFPDLVEEHLAAHAALGGRKASVLGTFEQFPDRLDGALTRYLERSCHVFSYAAMTPGATYGWNRFWTANVSVPAEALRAAGGFDESFRHYGFEDTDLAYRLEEQGYGVLFHPDARAHHDHLLGLDDLKRRQYLVASACVRFFNKHPTALAHADWRWCLGLTVESCDRYVVDRLRDLAIGEAEARSLAGTDLGALERAGHVGAAEAVVATLGRLVDELMMVWLQDGFAGALVAHGLTGFAELADVARHLPAHEAPPWHLDTVSTRRVLAWPRFDDAADLRALADHAAALAGDGDVCLCVRHDPAIDGDLDQALRMLELVVGPAVGDRDLELLLVTERMTPGDWPRLGAAVDALVRLPSSADGERAAFAAEIAKPALPEPPSETPQIPRRVLT